MLQPLTNDHTGKQEGAGGTVILSLYYIVAIEKLMDRHSGVQFLKGRKMMEKPQ